MVLNIAKYFFVHNNIEEELHLSITSFVIHSCNYSLCIYKKWLLLYLTLSDQVICCRSIKCKSFEDCKLSIFMRLPLYKDCIKKRVNMSASCGSGDNYKSVTQNLLLLLYIVQAFHNIF